MAKSQERIAILLEKQNPGKISQVLATGATAATAFGILGAIDIIVKWIGGLI